MHQLFFLKFKVLLGIMFTVYLEYIEETGILWGKKVQGVKL
jgi:hypothetical protein